MTSKNRANTPQVLVETYDRLVELATQPIEGREGWRSIPDRNGAAPIIMTLTGMSRTLAGHAAKQLADVGLLESVAGRMPESVQDRRRGPWFEVRVRVDLSAEQVLRLLEGEPADVVMAQPTIDLPTDLDAQVQELVGQLTALLKEREEATCLIESQKERIAALEEADRKHVADKIASAKQGEEAARLLLDQQRRITELEQQLKDLRNTGGRHPELDRVLKRLRDL